MSIRDKCTGIVDQKKSLSARNTTGLTSCCASTRASSAIKSDYVCVLGKCLPTGYPFGIFMESYV